ncbi:ABC1 kinase family protein [Gordonia sp. CPCC 205333]|uniref:ABC1 kinase family protein n=1 Tax=Gordonia sp. CPCC 205333 TaxID=3140790 RepID=UPI003AF404E2
MPEGRLRRGAALGELAARQVARTATTRISMIGHSDEARALLAERANLRALEQFVDILGKLKGGAMKAGQMLSVFDLSFVPEDRREDFRARIASLCDDAPAVAFESMHEVITAELGPIDAVFRDFDREPIGAASIGQVYRATLHDGRTVAVKVQYPGIGAAIRADIRNLRLFGKLMATQWPTLRDGSIFDELAAVLDRELDYRHEAQAQQAVAAKYFGHPFVMVPAVVTEFSTDHILVTDYVDGIPFAELCERGQRERNRYGELIYRFYVGGALRDGSFSGDPHPGNILGMADGRLCFLDFGTFHQLTSVEAQRERALIRAAVERDGPAVREVLVAAGVFGPDDEIDDEQCLSFVRDAGPWHAIDNTVRVTSEIATEALLLAVVPRDDGFNEIRRKQLPHEHLLSRRAEFLTIGLLGELRAEANWHRISREWLYDEPTETAIGRAEEQWLSSNR